MRNLFIGDGMDRDAYVPAAIEDAGRADSPASSVVGSID